MNLAALCTLVDYHYWARDRLLDALAPLSSEAYCADRGSSFRSIRDTAVHIYGAEWIWHERWMGMSPTALPSPAAFPDVASLHEAWCNLEGRVRLLVDGLGEADVAREVDYRGVTGQPGRSVLWHMVQHVVNHASYHRGQITTMLRQAGAAPGKSMDLIAFYRVRSVGGAS